MLIAVTGPDGSGKSTACGLAVKLLEEKLGEGKAARVSVWDAIASSGLFGSKSDVVMYLGDLDGYTRTLFIFHALSRSIDMALRKKPRLVLVEGHWYKYAVTEIAQGVTSKSVLGAASGMPVPAKTIFLDVDPATAWQRKKGAASQYEQGVGTTGETEERFLKFQAKLAPIWSAFEAQYGPWEHVSTLRSPEDVARELAESCLRSL